MNFAFVKKGRRLSCLMHIYILGALKRNPKIGNAQDFLKMFCSDHEYAINKNISIL